MIRPGKVNNAYGFLAWLNRGGTYALPNVEGPDKGTGQIVASGPRDMYLMAGTGEQRVFVIPSRDIVIVRLGERGSRELDTRVERVDRPRRRARQRAGAARPAGGDGRAVRRPGPLCRLGSLPAAAGRRGGGGRPGPEHATAGVLPP